MSSCFQPDRVSLEARLRHVCWIGGSPCSGKSTVTRMLAERHGLRVYTCDDEFSRHARGADSVRCPRLQRIPALTWDEIFLRPVEDQVADELAIYREEFPLIVADLLALPADQPIFAEGAALLPECVADVAASPRQAIWIVPTEDFQRERYAGRGAWVQEILRDSSDPERAFANWMARDASFARQVTRDAAKRSLAIVVVDGLASAAEIAARVEAHFALG